MRTESLRWLACPAPHCEGFLEPDGVLEPAWSETVTGELLEGVLACAGCGGQYPVLLGVAVLENDLESYLSAFWSEIESCAGEMTGTALSQPMRRYLGIPSAFTGQPGPALQGSQLLEWSASPYLQAHFDPDSLTSGLPGGWWKQAVDGHRKASLDPYKYLMRAARELAEGNRGLAVDVGTSVGRGAADLAGCHQYSLGVDRSFRAILDARRVMLGRPTPMEQYRVQAEKGVWEDTELPHRPLADNLDYVVASGAALPVASGAAACLAALNVLCAVSDPLAMLDDFRRTLAEGGNLLLSSPFWSDSEQDGESDLAMGGPDFVRRALAGGYGIIAEQDMVPWLLRLAKRRWNVYLCHCVVATKNKI